MSKVMPLLKAVDWDENPCGLDKNEDQIDCRKEIVAEETLLKIIIQNGTHLRNRIVELRKIWRKTFPEVDENSLKSVEYSFLKNEISVQSVFKDSHFTLRVCGHAFDTIINGIDKDSELKYWEQTQLVCEKLAELLCNLQVSLICKEKNTSNIEIPGYLINPTKYERQYRDTIFLRQIEENVRKVLAAFDKYIENGPSL